MRNRRITDTDAAAVMGGTAPAGRPDLADVATALSELRGSVAMSLPQPSTELRERLDAGAPGGVSAQFTPAQLAHEGITRASAGGARRLTARRARRRVGAIIALAIVGSLVTVTSAGAAGVLPGGVQEVFNRVVPVAPRPVDDAPTVGTTIDTPADDPAPAIDPVPSGTPSAPQPSDDSSNGSDDSPSPTPSDSPSAEPSPDSTGSSNDDNGTSGKGGDDKGSSGKSKDDKPKDGKSKDDKNDNKGHGSDD